MLKNLIFNFFQSLLYSLASGDQSLSQYFHSPTALNHSPCLAPYLKALQPTHVHHVIAALRNKTHHLHCFLFQSERTTEKYEEGQNTRKSNAWKLTSIPY